MSKAHIRRCCAGCRIEQSAHREQSRAVGAPIVNLLVKVFVRPRKGILDPQGRAVEQSLKTLGFTSVGKVSVGRYILLEIEAQDIEKARESVRQMCGQLLTNPNIEDYTFEIDSGEDSAQ